MASLGHIAVGMTAARLYRRKQRVRWSIITSMCVWSFVSMLPDADVLGFRFGIAYAAAWGHRGATHSFAFAMLVGTLIGATAFLFGVSSLRTGVCAVLVLSSHALLDTLTDGGLGCALLWPFKLERYFAPWNPLPVAPIGRAFFSAAGLRVAMAELLLFLPFWVYAIWPRRKPVPNSNAERSDRLK
jgi:inner membrane protein